MSEENLNQSFEQNCISTNQSKNRKIYSQTINHYDINIPIDYYLPWTEPDDEDSITPFINEESDIMPKKEIFKTKKYSRGRKRERSFDKDKTKIHSKLSKDNIQRKFNVFFLNYVVLLSNEIVAYFGYQKKFFKLEYKFKKNITQKSLKELKSLTFGELLRKNISQKWRKHSSNENIELYTQVIENENIKKIFSEKYLTIFKIFINNQRNIKLGEVDFYLPPRVKMFDTFLLNIKNKYPNDELYLEKINIVVKDYEKRISD